MTEKVRSILEEFNKKDYRKRREAITEKPQQYNDVESFVKYIKKIAELNKPLLFEKDRFGFNLATNIKIGIDCGNMTPDYEKALTKGFDKLKEEIAFSMSKNDDNKKLTFGKAMIESLDVMCSVSDGYKKLAEENGVTELYEALCQIPRKPARTFYEACVFMKLMMFFMRISDYDHIGLGRFDQYMYPFYESDIKRGIPKDEIFETLEEYFVAMNRDSDLYFGIQTGDNGQSMVLAGYDKDGRYLFNDLSEMCMQASLELNLIDPKINLRVGKNTPDEVFEFATRLTKRGLGFPQYCNDDVVVPGLCKLGYDYEDALDYTVAACWEYIIPHKGQDIPNLRTFDFPGVTNKAITENISVCQSFAELMDCVKAEIKNRCDTIVEAKHWFKASNPALSVFFDGCIENLCDVRTKNTKYQNFGCHGAGIANATDALMAVKTKIYEEKSISKEDLLSALENNFEGYEQIRKELSGCKKMGNNDEETDNISIELMKAFSKNLNGRKNVMGGVWRAGTGSAMEYILTAKKCGATADGRKAGEPYSSSFSPSIGAKLKGVLSVIQSFTKYDMTEIINGGPLTIEMHDTVFRNDMGIKKVAMLVKEFICRGGHQLQLNSVNGEILKDARLHPEKYPNLIVRVWGWSGYFNELDKKYQDHIISRTEFMG